MGIRSTANLSDLPPKEQVSLCIFFYVDKTPFSLWPSCMWILCTPFIYLEMHPSAMNYFTVNVRMPSWWEHSLFIFWARHWIMQISKWKTFTIFYWLCGTFSQISLFISNFRLQKLCPKKGEIFIEYCEPSPPCFFPYLSSFIIKLIMCVNPLKSTQFW